MTAIKMVWDSANLRGDLDRDGANIQTDDGLDTAVLISLFTNARAEASDVKAGSSLGGWWGDDYGFTDGDREGSRLWALFQTGKIDERLRKKAYALIDEALAWMIQDGIVDRIEKEIDEISPGMIAVRIGLFRPGDLAPSWVRAWEVSYGIQ